MSEHGEIAVSESRAILADRIDGNKRALEQEMVLFARERAIKAWALMLMGYRKAIRLWPHRRPFTFWRTAMNRHDSNDLAQQGPNWSRVNQWILWLGLAGAVVWLVVKHGAHLLEVWPFLFLLACPLLHLFGHRGHGGHSGHGGHGSDRSSEPLSREPASNAETGQADPPRGHSR